MTTMPKIKKAAKKKPAPVFELSKVMVGKLPGPERISASANLWKKSAGICALCELPLDLSTKDSVVADHKIPEAKGGKTTLANLYLAHRTCNASRQHLDFPIAQRLIHFRSFLEQKKTVDFDDVIDQYLTDKKRELIHFVLGDRSVTLGFGHHEVTVPVYRDPPTGVRYFFAEVPLEYIHNDEEIQPRDLMAGHVRRLAVDFLERPVHEPSNCRLVPVPKATTARLLQFDGQHKTTAQLLIGRSSAPMKIYIEPKIDMLQKLVIKIQQEIKKQPLTKSETLAKIGDVVARLLESYEEKKGKARSELGLVHSQPRAERAVTKKLYVDELLRIVFFHDENLLSKAVGPGVQNPPTTDKVVITKIIAPLLHPKPLEEDLDVSGSRDRECANILLVLNAIAEEVLAPGWEKNELTRLRAQNFFYQGSIGWWMNEILIPALRYVLKKINKPLFLDTIDEAEKEQVLNVVNKLCSWPIWSTKDADHLKAMRSNTIKHVAEAFDEYDLTRLLHEIEA